VLVSLGVDACLQLNKTMELLAKYCLNNRPVPFQILSDQSNLVAK